MLARWAFNLCCCLFLPGHVWADSPRHPWEGLPETLSPHFLEEDGFIAFDEISEFEARRLRAPKNYAPAPIASDFFFDDQPIDVRDRETQHLVFSEETFALLPIGQSVVVDHDSRGREIWTYPAGFTVSHAIRFRDTARTPYEIRIVKKLPSGAWAYGVYEPSAVGAKPVLKLNTYEGWPSARYQVHLVDHARAQRQTLLASRVVDVKLKRVKLDTCQGCHFSNSIADHQYEVLRPDGKVDWRASSARTGPCGFVPGHPTLKTEWAARYEERHPGTQAFKPLSAE